MRQRYPGWPDACPIARLANGSYELVSTAPFKTRSRGTLTGSWGQDMACWHMYVMEQEAGLLPIMQAVVSFERGSYAFERTAYAQELLLTQLFAACRQNGVMLEGCLLQTSITCPGAERYSSTALRNELWSGNQALLSAEPGAAAVAREALSADAVNEVLTLSRASLRRRDLPRGGALSRLSCRRAFAPRA